MLGIIGLVTVISIVALLLSGRVTPVVALTVIPIIAAFACGFSFVEIEQFFNIGINKVISIVIMFIFAILYFGIMQDVGLFNPLINFMVKISNTNIITVCIGTVIIGAVAHLDGSGASTFLITIPALLPLYNRLNMSPYLLLLLISASASIMNMVPWGGPLGRAAAVIEVDPAVLWQPLIPLQFAAFIILIGMAIILGMREKRRIANNINDYDHDLTQTYQPKTNKIAAATSVQNEPKYFYFNLTLTLIVILTLVFGLMPSALAFMLATCIALTINYPSVNHQMERIKAHAPSAIVMASILIAAGVFLGVLHGTNMLNALALDLVNILPQSIVPYLHLIVGFFGAPFELLLNTDAYYFALLPVVEQIVTNYGVTPESAAYSMLIGNVIGTFISPFSPALWLAIGLARLEIGRHIIYSFFWIWGLSIILLVIAYLMGII